MALIFARAKSIIRHKHLMLVMLGGGWGFVLLYLTGYILGESYSESVSPELVPWLTIHGIIALITLLAVTLLIWARISSPKDSKESGVRAYINDHHRLLGMITALLWLITQAGGFVNLYILR